MVCKRVALHNMMRYDEAIQCYTRALAIDPGNAVVVSLKKAAQADWDQPELIDTNGIEKQPDKHLPCICKDRHFLFFMQL